MIIESVAAAGAILSTISTAINKLNEVGDGASKAVELMQGFSDALDSFEREKKDSVISNLSSQNFKIGIHQTPQGSVGKVASRYAHNPRPSLASTMGRC
jgi:hypothetical protein